MVGQCHVIFGPMFAKKTTHLIKMYRDFTNENVNVKAFKHSSDVRYEVDKLCTHDHDTIPCISILRTNEIFLQPDYDLIKNIIIDEAHFFDESIIDDLHKILNDGKNVIIAGLSGDYRMKPIGKMSEIISMSELKTSLVSKCSYCNIDAHFTAKIKGSHEIIEVGFDIYKPVCRKHHSEYSIM